MKIVALNGYRSPVDDDFSEVAPGLIESGQVVCPYVPNWTGSNRDLETVMDAADTDYVLAAHSDGCLAAYRVACIDTRVQALVIHSGLWRDGFFRSTLRGYRMQNIPLYFFRTIGDRTPTFKQTLEAYRYFDSLGYEVHRKDYEPTETNWLLRKLRHEFRNCIPDLLKIAGVEPLSEMEAMQIPLSITRATIRFTNRIIGAYRKAA